jgi:hypothetical protein
MTARSWARNLFARTPRTVRKDVTSDGTGASITVEGGRTASRIEGPPMSDRSSSTA